MFVVRVVRKMLNVKSFINFGYFNHSDFVDISQVYSLSVFRENFPLERRAGPYFWTMKNLEK